VPSQQAALPQAADSTILARTLQAARELFAKLLDNEACEVIDDGWARSQPRGYLQRQVDAHGRARDHQEDLRRRFGAFQAMAD
jgi:hypothetical protein